VFQTVDCLVKFVDDWQAEGVTKANIKRKDLEMLEKLDKTGEIFEVLVSEDDLLDIEFTKIGA